MSNLASLAQWRNFRSNARKLPTKCGPNVHKSGRKSHKRILDIGRDPSVSVFSSDYRRRHNNPSFCHVGENINRHGDHRLALITNGRERYHSTTEIHTAARITAMVVLHFPHFHAS